MDKSEKENKPAYKRPEVWMVVGVIVLVALLLLWSDIVDMFGGGADFIQLFI